MVGVVPPQTNEMTQVPAWLSGTDALQLALINNDTRVACTFGGTRP